MNSHHDERRKEEVDAPAVSERKGEEPSKRRSIVIVVLLVLLSEVFAFEFNLIAPALPNISAHFGVTSVSIVFGLGLLVGAVMVPVLARIADRYGKKKILLVASGAVAVGALICVWAPTYELLLLGRGIQGLGMIGSVITYGLVRDLLPARYVPLGVGGIGVGFGVSGLLGPLLGGWLIDNHGWRSTFWFLAVYVVVTALLVAVFVPETDVRAHHKVDFMGAALLGLGVGMLMYAATFKGHRIEAAIAGVILLIVFYLVERRASNPLISFALLKYPPVWTTLAACALLGGAVASSNGVLPQMLRAGSAPGSTPPGMALSATEYAIYLGVPFGVMGAAAGLVGGWCSRRWGPRNVLAVGGACWMISCAMLATGAVHTIPLVLVVGAFFGVGQGCYYASSGNLLIEAVPATSQGIGSSMKFQAEQLTGAVALAVFGLIITHSLQGRNPATGMMLFDMHGFQVIYVTLAVATLLGVIGVLRMKHGRSPASGGTVSNRPEVVALEEGTALGGVDGHALTRSERGGAKVVVGADSELRDLS